MSFKRAWGKSPCQCAMKTVAQGALFGGRPCGGEAWESPRPGCRIIMRPNQKNSVWCYAGVTRFTGEPPQGAAYGVACPELFHLLAKRAPASTWALGNV